MLPAKSQPATQLADTRVLQVPLGSLGPFSSRDCRLLTRQPARLDKAWGPRAGWRILASILTRPGKVLTQKPLDCCPHHTPPRVFWLYLWLISLGRK